MWKCKRTKTSGNGIRSPEWTLCCIKLLPILWFILDCCRVNAYLVYKKASSRTIRNKRYTHLDFVIELGRAMIRNFTSRKSVHPRIAGSYVRREQSCEPCVSSLGWESPQVQRMPYARYSQRGCDWMSYMQHSPLHDLLPCNALS